MRPIVDLADTHVRNAAPGLGLLLRGTPAVRRLELVRGDRVRYDGLLYYVLGETIDGTGIEAYDPSSWIGANLAMSAAVRDTGVPFADALRTLNRAFARARLTFRRIV